MSRGQERIHEVDLAVPNGAGVGDGVQRILTQSLPVFLIEAALEKSHIDIVNEVKKELRHLTGFTFRDAVHDEDIVERGGLTDRGVGRLHHDYDPSLTSPDTYNVHTTRRGIGIALFANSGFDYNPLDTALQVVAAEYLKDGFVDPAIMDRKIYRGVLAEGDTVVSPVATSRGPIWHRFDTLVGPREAELTIIQPSMS